MFEKFSDRASRVVIQAQEQARMYGHDQVGPEHLLLALIQSEGVADQILRSVDVDLADLRKQVASKISDGSQEASGNIPFTPRAKEILEEYPPFLRSSNDLIGYFDYFESWS